VRSWGRQNQVAAEGAPTTRASGSGAGVAAMSFGTSARALIHASMRVALDGTDAGATFAEGHELDADHAARVPRNRLGTMI
jgi:hypothetical protein